MNIFAIHRHTTSRIEPFHARYLAACLKHHPGLRSSFWRLATSGADGWAPPPDATVTTEEALNEGKRVDIVVWDRDTRRLLSSVK